MNIRVISFTRAGQNLSIKLKELLETEDSMVVALYSKCRFWQYGAEEFILPWEEDMQTFAGQAFEKKEALVFIGACGIAVRSIAPFVQDKKTDPPVIVMDEKGDYVIPLLSSHLGGGEELASRIAGVMGARLISTTSSDVNHFFAVDTFAKENGLKISDMGKAKEVAAHVVDGKKCVIFLSEREFEVVGELPQGVEICFAKGDSFYMEKAQATVSLASDKEAISSHTEMGETVGVFISNKNGKEPKESLQLIPRNIILGVGCKKGKTSQELLALILYVLDLLELLPDSVKCIASIDLKKEEQGLLETAEFLNVPFVTFSARELERQKLSGNGEDFSESEFVQKVTGVSNVCERAAMAAGADMLLQKKVSYQGMTIAVGLQKGIIHFE